MSRLPPLIARFLKHLWATDGCLWYRDGRFAIYYATSSEQLARDVQSLLLRLGITAVLATVAQRGYERPQFHVRISGLPTRCDSSMSSALSASAEGATARAIIAHVHELAPNTNRDMIPRDAWRSTVVPAMASAGVTARELQARRLAASYCGSALYKSNLSRDRAAGVAEIVSSAALSRLATSDVYWDRIASIEPDGEAEVFDLTVEKHHNFVAEDIVVHNSIEQDADLVMFIYRDEYYDPESEDEGLAELLISKHRNGGLGKVTLTFQKDYPRFMSYVGEDRYGP